MSAARAGTGSVAGHGTLGIRRWIGVVAWGLLTVHCLVVGAGAAESGVEPTIRFLSSRVDVGRIAPQQRIPLTLDFTNAGPAWVEVTNVARSCSCVGVVQWSRRVGPGSTGRVEVLFYAPEQVGPIAEQVALQGQGRGHPGGEDLATLEIAGEVWQPIEARPGFVGFSSATNSPMTVRIVNHLDEPVEVFDPVSSHPNFRATLKRVTAGREYQLIIEPLPPFPNANLFARIRLKTDSEIMRELVVSVFMPAASPARPASATGSKPAAGEPATRPANPLPRDRGHR